MKIERLIGIICILQNKRKVTAPYLAKKFEVSRRTINRDIEEICRAGIPIVTTQGADGGISIMEGFRFDTTVFTKDELQSIFVGLKSMDSVLATPHSITLADKISVDENVVTSMTDHIIIDLSSFHKDSLAPKIQSIRQAIMERKLITFHYYYKQGEVDKIIEPYSIVFKWSSWYVHGYCLERNAFRLYKLDRLWNLTITDTSYDVRFVPEEELDFNQHFVDNYQITAEFEESVKYRLVEEYGHNSFTTLDSGRLLFQVSFTNKEVAISWFLGFGSKVRIIDPSEFRDELRQIGIEIAQKNS